MLKLQRPTSRGVGGHLAAIAILAVAIVSLLAAAPSAYASPDCDEYNTSLVCPDLEPPPSHDPFGSLTAHEFSWSYPPVLRVHGVAVDPDTNDSIDVRIDVVDGLGSYSAVTTASLWSDLTGAHGFELVVPLRFYGWGTYCVTAINVGAGSDGGIGCGGWLNT
jgi:hypothetical protein